MDIFDLIIEQQEANGLFAWNNELRKIFKAQTKPKKCNFSFEIDEKVWLTIAILVYLSKHFMDRKNLWDLLAKKAKKKIEAVVTKEEDRKTVQKWAELAII